MNFYSIFPTHPLGIILFSQLLLSCSPKSEVDKTKPASEDHNRKLLVIENDFYTKNNKLRINLHLVAYNFEDGKYVSKDTLCNFKPATLDEYETYSLYKNRYIISKHGFIFDLQTNKVLLNTDYKFLSHTGDSLIYYKYEYPKLGGYVFDLKTNSYTPITNSGLCTKNTSYDKIAGTLSPDTRHGLKSNGVRWNPTKDLQLVLYDSSNTLETIVEMGGMGTYQHGGSSDSGTIPVYWLNNSTFIYAKYLFPEVKYRVNVEIHKVNIHTRSDQNLCRIDTIKGTLGDAIFYRDELGDLLLEHGDKKYLFNKDLTQVHSILFENKGNDFELEVGIYKKTLEIKHDTITLGKFACYSPEVKTTKNHIALFSDKGIRVWNNYTKEWTFLPSPWHRDIIGWIE